MTECAPMIMTVSPLCKLPNGSRLSGGRFVRRLLSPLFRSVTNRFNVVSVKIEDECAVVVRMIHRPQSRCAVVAPACSEGRLVEGIDCRTIRGQDGDMDRSGGAWGDPEVGLPRGTEASCGTTEFHDERIAQGCKGVLEEPLAARVV